VNLKTMAPEPDRTREIPAPSNTRSLRILCADDNLLLGAMLVRLLGSAGHRADQVPDGMAAWAALEAPDAGFDLVITDHQMPRLGGLELVRRLRTTGYRGRIIVHSSHLPPGEAAAYRALAVDAILSKPVPPAVLLAFVTA
jgi:CheY-like chemotaxis protein